MGYILVPSPSFFGLCFCSQWKGRFCVIYFEEGSTWEQVMRVQSGVFVKHYVGIDSQFPLPSAIDAQSPPSVCLYAFYCGPLQCTTVGSHDSHMTLPLPQQYSRVVEVLDCLVPNYQQIAVVSGTPLLAGIITNTFNTLPSSPPSHTHTRMQVQESGDLTVFDFNGDNGCWSFKSQGV